MAKINVKIQGLDGFIEGLKKAPEFTINEMNKAVTHSISILQNQTIKEAPVNKEASGGNLRQSVHSSMETKIRGAVSVDAKYGLFVEMGTKPHEIRPVNKKGLANVRQGKFFGKLVRHPGTRANPFLERAIDRVTPNVLNFFKVAINNVLNTIATMAK